MSQIISVPHEVEPSDMLMHSNRDYVQTLKRGFDLAGERVTSVVEVKDVREKRRKDGYLPEDGTFVLRGSEKESDKNDLYGEKWVQEFVARQLALDMDPHMNFVRLLAGMANDPLQTFIDESLVNRATAAKIERAERVLEDLRRKQQERDASESTINEQQARLVDSQKKRDELASQLLRAQFTANQFVNLVNSEVAIEQANFIKGANNVNDTQQQVLFNNLVRGLARRYGSSWRTNAIEYMVGQLTLTINRRQPAANVKDNMPLNVRVAFFVSCAAQSRFLIEINNAMLESNAISFPPTSDYAKDPYLFYRDVLLLGGYQENINWTLSDQITFVLYAHLNKMRRRYGLPDDLELSRPVDKRRNPRAAAAAAVPNREFDFEEEDLLNISEGNTGLYTPEQLNTAQNTLYKNDNPQRTFELVDQLLQPFAYAFIPRAFFRDNNRLASEAGVGRPVIVYIQMPPVQIPAVVAILYTAFNKFELRGVNDQVAILANEFNAGVGTPSERQKYEERGIKEVIIDSGILRAFAEAIVAYKDAGVTLEGLSTNKIDQLIKFLADQTKADEAYGVLTRTFLAGANLVQNNPLLVSDSAKQFYSYFQDITKLNSVGLRLEKAKDSVEEEERVYRAFLDQRARRIADNQKEVVMTLSQALQETYVPTANVALSPLNSGLIFYTPATVAALSASYDILRMHVPCLVRRFASSNELILADDYSQAYAQLVSSQVRLSDARNPSTYRQTVHETRARLQVRSALDHIRQLCGADRDIKHVDGCTCFIR
jgi:hypothetical protein